jgi:hypothetical protein
MGKGEEKGGGGRREKKRREKKERKKERRKRKEMGEREKGEKKKESKRQKKGKGGHVGADRGGDRGRSATCVRHPRTAREKNRAGVDCGKAVARGHRPPSGAGWDSGQVRCRSGRVRARVLTMNGF